MITITSQEDWRLPEWTPELPARPAWFVSCSDHPELGKLKDGRPWGYNSSARARGVATRHRHSKHPGQI